MLAGFSGTQPIDVELNREKEGDSPNRPDYPSPPPELLTPGCVMARGFRMSLRLCPVRAQPGAQPDMPTTGRGRYFGLSVGISQLRSFHCYCPAADRARSRHGPKPMKIYWGARRTGHMSVPPACPTWPQVLVRHCGAVGSACIPRAANPTCCKVQQPYSPVHSTSSVRSLPLTAVKSRYIILSTLEVLSLGPFRRGVRVRCSAVVNHPPD